MDKKDKIMIAVLVGVVVVIFFYTRTIGAGVNSQPSIASSIAPSTNVPWYLSYNNSPAFQFAPNSQQIIPLALPNNSVGQANDGQTGDCFVCSLFPNYKSVQL